MGTVEKIIAKKGEGKRAMYRVKWLGYSNTKNTWEKLENLQGAKKLIAAFDKKEAEKALKIAEKDYVIERIVKEKFHRKALWYYIKWSGYKSERNTWEPAESIKETCADRCAEWEDLKVKREARRE